MLLYYFLIFITNILMLLLLPSDRLWTPNGRLKCYRPENTSNQSNPKGNMRGKRI